MTWSIMLSLIFLGIEVTHRLYVLILGLSIKCIFVYGNSKNTTTSVCFYVRVIYHRLSFFIGFCFCDNRKLIKVQRYTAAIQIYHGNIFINWKSNMVTSLCKLCKLIKNVSESKVSLQMNKKYEKHSVDEFIKLKK